MKKNILLLLFAFLLFACNRNQKTDKKPYNLSFFFKPSWINPQCYFFYEISPYYVNPKGGIYMFFPKTNLLVYGTGFKIFSIGSYTIKKVDNSPLYQVQIKDLYSPLSELNKIEASTKNNTDSIYFEIIHRFAVPVTDSILKKRMLLHCYNLYLGEKEIHTENVKESINFVDDYTLKTMITMFKFQNLHKKISARCLSSTLKNFNIHLEENKNYYKIVVDVFCTLPENFWLLKNFDDTLSIQYDPIEKRHTLNNKKERLTHITEEKLKNGIADEHKFYLDVLKNINFYPEYLRLMDCLPTKHK